MALTKDQRKRRMPKGAQSAIARELGIAPSVVSAVMNNKAQLYAKETVQRVKELAAQKMGEPVEEVWGTAA
jgi:hypothetical protein